jgi:hypothetical protein
LNGSGIHNVQAIEKNTVVKVRVLTSHIQKRLRYRQRRAELMGCVGCEALLLGDVFLELIEHRVEGVSEFAELVLSAF